MERSTRRHARSTPFAAAPDVIRAADRTDAPEQLPGSNRWQTGAVREANRATRGETRADGFARNSTGESRQICPEASWNTVKSSALPDQDAFSDSTFPQSNWPCRRVHHSFRNPASSITRGSHRASRPGRNGVGVACRPTSHLRDRPASGTHVPRMGSHSGTRSHRGTSCDGISADLQPALSALASLVLAGKTKNCRPRDRGQLRRQMFAGTRRPRG